MGSRRSQFLDIDLPDDVPMGEIIDFPSVSTSTHYSPSRVRGKGKEQGKRGVGGTLLEVQTPVNPLVLAWQAVEAAFRKWYHQPDLQAARILYASLAAHRMTGQPVWPMFIAPPGSMKTELLNSLRQESGVWAIDSVSTNTFLSGQIGQRSIGVTVPGGDPTAPSLLHRIGDSGVIMIPDFSTISGMRQDQRMEIFGQLRRIFDGDLSSEKGTAGCKLRWSGRITVCVAATPAIDAQHSLESVLGERFVRIRMERGQRDAALRAMRQEPKKVQAAMRKVVHELFARLPARPSVTIPAAVESRIADLAEFTAIARSPIIRNTEHRIYGGGPEEVESATRLSQQLVQLLKGHVALDGRSRAQESDLAILERVAWDSIPPRRAAILKDLIAGRPVSKGTSTRQYDVEELQHLGLVAESEIKKPLRLSRTALDLLGNLVTKGA